MGRSGPAAQKSSDGTGSPLPCSLLRVLRALRGVITLLGTGARFL